MLLPQYKILKQIYFGFCFELCFVCLFVWLHSRHAEVSGPGIKPATPRQRPQLLQLQWQHLTPLTHKRTPLRPSYPRSLWGKPAALSWGHSRVLWKGPCGKKLSLQPSAIRGDHHGSRAFGPVKTSWLWETLSQNHLLKLLLDSWPSILYQRIYLCGFKLLSVQVSCDTTR